MNSTVTAILGTTIIFSDILSDKAFSALAVTISSTLLTLVLVILLLKANKSVR